ncbi:MAG TPA: DNA polymerase III subunit beta [Gammaproteobacteria bacterium]|nr:DNA polymerase III subunit beta [Gammaproteobacteria bacterium]
MNLTIQREALLEPLQLVIGVVERRQTMPILANVLLTVEDDVLSVTATDLEIELIGRSRLEAPVKEPMQITISGRKLLDICRTLPEKVQIDLSQDKERLIVRSGRSRFILATMPVENFPAFEEGQTNLEFSVEQKHFNNLLQRTHFAMAQQDVRYYLNGMLFELKEGKMRTVATDGHRFAMTSIATPLAGQEKTQVIMPRKGVMELLRLLKNEASEVVAVVGENHLRVRGEAFTFTSKLIDGRFPDYERVLPKTTGKFVAVDRDALREALMRVAILSNEKVRAVRLQLRSNLLHILANNPEQEEAEEVLTVDYDGEDMEIAFNVTYLLDVLNTVNTGEIKLTFLDANSRMFMEEANNEDSLFLIMPLQI